MHHVHGQEDTISNTSAALTMSGNPNDFEIAYMKYIMPSRKSKTDNVIRVLWPVARASLVVLYVANQVMTMTMRSAAISEVREMIVTAIELNLQLEICEWDDDRTTVHCEVRCSSDAESDITLATTNLIESAGGSMTYCPHPHTGSIVIVDQRKSACDGIRETVALESKNLTYKVNPYGHHR